jgi:hypothetical protein
MAKITEIKNLGDAGLEKLREMSKDAAVYIDFLKFQGRLFKQNAAVALEFFAQKPDTEYIATAEQWLAAGYKIKNGGMAIHFTDDEGISSNLFDFSQIVGDNPPKIWAINADSAKEIKTELDIPADKYIISVVIEQTVSKSHVTDCMKALEIPPNDFDRFSKTFYSAVQTVIGGRLEIGGNKFNISPDMTAFATLSEAQKMDFLTYISDTARKSLYHIEHAANKINAKIYNERNEKNELQRMERADLRGASEDTGERIADNSASGTDERTEPVENDTEGRREVLGSDDRGSEGNGNLPRVQTGADVGQDDMVQIQPDDGNIRAESDELRAVNGRRTNRELRHEVDNVDKSQSPAFGEPHEVSAQPSDSGEVGGQGGMGISGVVRQPVRGDEPAPDELRGHSIVGNNESLLHRRVIL